MGSVPFVLVEAERVWFQQTANGLGPEDEGTWKYVKHPQLVGRVLPAPPSDTRLRFGRYRKAVEGHDSPGLVGIGQGAVVVPGRYRVTWWLVAEPLDSPPSTVLVTVAVEARRQKVAAHQVVANTLRRGAGPIGVPLEFTFDEVTNSVDFVAWWQGKGEVSFLRAECLLLR